MSCSTPGQGRSCSLGSVIQACIVLGMGITEIDFVFPNQYYFIWKTQFTQPRPNLSCHLEMGEGLPQTRDLPIQLHPINLLSLTGKGWVKSTSTRVGTLQRSVLDWWVGTWMVHAIALAVAHISYLDTTWESQGFNNHM